LKIKYTSFLQKEAKSYALQNQLAIAMEELNLKLSERFYEWL